MVNISLSTSAANLREFEVQRDRTNCFTVARLLLLPILGILIVLYLMSSVTSDREHPIELTHEASTVEYQFISEQVDTGVVKYRLIQAGSQQPVSVATVLNLLSDASSAFPALLADTLKHYDSTAYFWECPPVTSETVRSTSFEFVLIKSESLSRKKPDPRAFESHFHKQVNGITSFMSLGGDALLVVPCPVHSTPLASYTHIGAFMRDAPSQQIKHLLSRAALELLQRLNDLPHPTKHWISTSGLGVFWLHVRLDTVPKYYHWKEYSKA